MLTRPVQQTTTSSFFRVGNQYAVGRPSGGNLETFWRWDASSNLDAVTRTGIFFSRHAQQVENKDYVVGTQNSILLWDPGWCVHTLYTQKGVVWRPE